MTLWKTTCCKELQKHVEQRVYDRVIGYLRLYNQIISEAEAKERIINLTSISKRRALIKRFNNNIKLPKYQLIDILPKSKIWINVIYIEDKKKKKRKIKTIWTDWEEKFPA